MNRYSLQERDEIVSMFQHNNSSVALTQREFRRRFPKRLAPTPQTIRRLAAQFEQTGTTRDSPRSGRPRTGLSPENINAVRESLQLEPGTSIRKRAAQLGLSTRSLQRILNGGLVDTVPCNIKEVSEVDSKQDGLAKRLSGVLDDEVVVFVRFLLSQLRTLQRSVGYRVMGEIEKLVAGKTVAGVSGLGEVSLKKEMELGEYSVGVKQEVCD